MRISRSTKFSTCIITLLVLFDVCMQNRRICLYKRYVYKRDDNRVGRKDEGLRARWGGERG